MKDYSFLSNAHPSYIEAMYEQYLQQPDAVEESWRFFFKGFDYNRENGAAPATGGGRRGR